MRILIFIIAILLIVNHPALSSTKKYIIVSDRIECSKNSKTPIITKGAVHDDIDKLKFTCLTHDETEKMKNELGFASIDKDGNQACIAVRRGNFMSKLEISYTQFDCAGGFILVEENN